MKKNILFLFMGCLLVFALGCKGKEPVTRVPQSVPSSVESAIGKEGDIQREGQGSTVVKSPPSGSLFLPVRIEVSPENPRRRDTIKLNLTGVPDGGTVGYEWRHNGILLNESGNSLKLPDVVKRGEKIDCKVSVTVSGRTDVWTVSTVVSNSMPDIEVAATITKIQDRTYRITFKATDADGDSLSYSLKEPLEGAVIDKQTGEIQYSIPAGKSGSHAFVVLVSDGNGGDLVYNIAFEIQ